MRLLIATFSLVSIVSAIGPNMSLAATGFYQQPVNQNDRGNNSNQKADNPKNITLTPVSPPTQSADKKPSGDKGNEHNIEVHVIVPEKIVIESKKDFGDFIIVFCTVILTGIGAVGTWVAIKTLKQIRKQARHMREHAVHLRRLSTAISKSLKLQEAQLKQWIEIIDVAVINPSSARLQPGVTEFRMSAQFTIRNPSGMFLTLDWIITRIDEGEPQIEFIRQHLAPGDPYGVNKPVILRGGQIERYAAYTLQIPIIVTVGYSDAFKKPIKECFGFVCTGGPPNLTRVSMYQGILPDDDIEGNKNG